MKTTSTSVKRLTKLALLIAIELVMRTIGLGAVPVGPLVMSFLTLPIAVGAILCGPLEGMVMGYPGPGEVRREFSFLKK